MRTIIRLGTKTYPGYNTPLIHLITKDTSRPRLTYCINTNQATPCPLNGKWKIHELLPPQIKDKQIKQIWNKARANLRANLEKSRKYHERNIHNNSVRYQVGDLVMYKTHPTSSAIDKTTSKPVSYTHLRESGFDTPAQLSNLSGLDYESEREICNAKYLSLIHI